MARAIGYARVSTGEQSTHAQQAELAAAGCAEILSETGSGGDRERPVLRALLERIGAGETLVVVRLDRLARSLAHLCEVLERLAARGAHFRSLHDPIDTASPQGRFTLQVLGAAAELERALIRERTMAGLAAARAAGRQAGNPGLRAGAPETIRALAAARGAAHLERMIAGAGSWAPVVRRLRPQTPWADVVRAVNAGLPPGAPQWSEDRLRRAARRMVGERLLPESVMARADPRPPDDRRLALVAAIASGSDRPTLAEIAARLDAIREPTPRGRGRWQVSSVHMLLERARQQGLLDPGPG